MILDVPITAVKSEGNEIVAVLVKVAVNGSTKVNLELPDTTKGFYQLLPGYYEGSLGALPGDSLTLHFNHHPSKPEEIEPICITKFMPKAKA
ncbi:MAG: hypothetical protein UX26_C0010G0006 [Parcubacteria group bacterium GW2011_GWC1_45_9]|nr:MAG: hypothetical protein UW89_C0015G0002 [Parcubacteria group bacterium GW2011_GWB1_45_10]KKU17004.1 MAG: hypothetical protein UX26_C0010G0006 [Parcubacteria group bacterium GW2011_GWC1_45_9]